MKLILILISFVPPTGPACLWMHGTTIDGDSMSVGGIHPASRFRNAMMSFPEEKIGSLVRDHYGNPLAESIPLENVALEEIAEGNYDTAISVLKKIEAEDPGNYSIAANLGTAYELNGDLDQALEWINESIKRNPDSHYGTEWLHEEILREKIRMRDRGVEAKPSDFLPVPQEFDSDAVIRVSGRQFTPEEVSKAIFHQLNERMVFVKPKDPIVAELLFDYAMIEANTRVLESAIEVLDLASEYGFSNTELIKKKKNEYLGTIQISRRKPFIWAASAALIVLSFLVYAYRKKWFFLSGAAYKRHKQEVRPSHVS